MRFYTLFLINFICFNHLISQTSAHNVYLFDIMSYSDGSKTLANPKLLTKFNENNYNNQPYIKDASTVLITADIGNQTDILSLNWKQKNITNLTNTKNFKEYSPRPHNGGISFVKVESDGSQRIWHQKGNESNVLFPDLKDVGYYTIAKNGKVYAFLLDNHKFVEYTPSTKNRKVIIDRIGRSIHEDSQGNIYFIHKFKPQFIYLKKYSPNDAKIQSLGSTPGASEDFTIDGNNTIWLASANKIYIFKNRTWVEVADLKNLGVSKVTRISVRGNQIAVVTE